VLKSFMSCFFIKVAFLDGENEVADETIKRPKRNGPSKHLSSFQPYLYHPVPHVTVNHLSKPLFLE